jgi:hypothetical protein
LKKSQVLGKNFTGRKKLSAYNGLKQILCKKNIFDFLKICQVQKSQKVHSPPLPVQKKKKKILAAPWVP